MRLSDIFVSGRSEEFIRQIYPKTDAGRMIRKHGKRKSWMFILVIAASVFLSIPVFVSDRRQSKTPVRELGRNEAGYGSRSVTLDVTAEDGYSDRITVKVNERVYSDEELEEYSAALDEVLWKVILGENESASYVTSKLNLPDRIEGFPFDITWKTDNPRILGASGIIDKEKLKEEDSDNEGIQVQLCATCKYKDYREDKIAYVELHSIPKSVRDITEESIDLSIKESDNKSQYEHDQKLPEYAGKTPVRFYKSSANKGWAVLFIGIVSAFLLMAVSDRKIKDKAETRKKQIEADYPNILSQYALYHTAGMNPRAIWYNICGRYEENLDVAGKNRRYAYEEMITTKKMMEEGCGELNAYDEFACRCQSIKYRSFVCLVKQSVIKGGRDLDNILEEELGKAQRDKNNTVRMQASEAETKLLLPMFMMLVTVIAIVIIPAFIGLND